MNETKRKVKIWITKYALTRGLLSASAKIDPDGWAEGIIDSPVKGWPNFCLPESDYRTSYKEACLAAIEKRDKKIASLKKQIKTLENIKFV